MMLFCKRNIFTFLIIFINIFLHKGQTAEDRKIKKWQASDGFLKLYPRLWDNDKQTCRQIQDLQNHQESLHFFETGEFTTNIKMTVTASDELCVPGCNTRNMAAFIASSFAGAQTPDPETWKSPLDGNIRSCSQVEPCVFLCQCPAQTCRVIDVVLWNPPDAAWICEIEVK